MKLLNSIETANLLGLKEEELEVLVKEGKLPSYKLGGEHLRFRKEEVLRYRVKFSPYVSVGFGERLRDFLYFNDFYIVSAVIIVGVFYFIFK